MALCQRALYFLHQNVALATETDVGSLGRQHLISFFILFFKVQIGKYLSVLTIVFREIVFCSSATGSHVSRSRLIHILFISSDSEPGKTSVGAHNL